VQKIGSPVVASLINGASPIAEGAMIASYSVKKSAKKSCADNLTARASEYSSELILRAR